MRLSNYLNRGLPAFVLAVLLLLSPVSEAARWQEVSADLDTRLQRIERQVDSQGIQEMYQRLEILDQENRTLRGEVEQLGHQLQNVLERNRQLYLEIDQRMQAIESRSMPPASFDDGLTSEPIGPASTGVSEPHSAIQAPVTPVAETTISAAEVDDEQVLYRAAFERLKQRDFDAAMQGFEGFIYTYPQSSLAANAQYWLGESAYGSGAFQRASIEFERVLNRYPGSQKFDDAALKLGYSYYELRQWAKARTVLTDLMMRSSGSTVGKLAAERLKRMKREGY